MLPVRLVQFWYPDALATFIRTYIHLISLLEEDLAVGLMWRLLFTPLFHDSSFVGRILSFLFRSVRILIGLFAYLIASLLMLVSSLLWFFWPVLLFVPQTRIVSFFIALFGIALFIDRVWFFPKKKLWQIHAEVGHSLTPQDIWQTTKLTKKEVSWNSLLLNEEVQNLIKSLELDNSFFSQFQVNYSDEILPEVFNLAKDAHAQYITSGYFWTAMVLSIPGIDNELLKAQQGTQDLKDALNLLEYKRNSWRMINLWDEDFSVKHLKGVNRGWLGAPTPMLDSISFDLTKQAAMVGFPDFLGREATVSEVITVLSQDQDRNVLLVAPPGAGRTALVDYLAAMIVAGNAPKALATKRLVSLDLTRLLSGVQGQGDLAAKIKEAFEEVRFIKDVIIFVDEIHTLGMGEAGGSLNLLALMEPYLDENSFQFIGATEPSNYAKVLEKNGSFARIFHKIELPIASVDDTIKIIQERSIELERRQGVVVTSRAIKELVTLSGKLIHDRVLPDSAISILKECQTLASSQNLKQKIITSQVVKDVFSKRVNVPLDSLNTDQREVLLNLEQIIHERMVDQEEAVKAVADTLRRSATALRDANRPIGSFLFVGPTGVGKTELAKTLAEVYFSQPSRSLVGAPQSNSHSPVGEPARSASGSSSLETFGTSRLAQTEIEMRANAAPSSLNVPFIRFDMSEYQTPEAVNRLIGDENNPGELTEAVKRKPYCLILLDEFEKADPKILTLFLQVLDDGRLTDSSGTTIDFTNTIIIATSNAASVLIAQELQSGQSLETVKSSVQEELLKTFRPELVNRFDEIVVFKPLSQADLQKIVTLKLEELKKLLKDGGYLVEFTPELIAQLGVKGFDPVLGARPLRRLIQDSLEAKLSRMILQNSLPKGESFKVGVEILN